MSKRRQRQDCNCGKRSRTKPDPRHKHLYVILDDFKNGYSIHKLDLSRSSYESEEESDSDNGDHCPSDPPTGRLPEPPALRLGLACHENSFFAALGTSIFMANSLVYHGRPPAVLYDTQTATLSMGRRVPKNLSPSIVVAIPAAAAADSDDGGVDGKMQQEPPQEQLYVLSCGEYLGSQLGLQASFQVMSWVRTTRDVELRLFQPSHEWTWENVPTPLSPFSLNTETVSSFVMHPDGRTLFFSMRETINQSRDTATYSFDFKGREWRSHGEWVLPFRGQGYYDTELDAWVGLAENGHVCVCRVASRGSGSGSGSSQGPLGLKMTKDKLLHEVGTDARRHLGATLTYMGNSRFCIVESVVRDDVELRNVIRNTDSSVLHVTVFGLKYNYKGELETTSRRTTNSYVVSKNISGFSPRAFWM